jgi:two-component system, OmpR family, response regulator
MRLWGKRVLAVDDDVDTLDVVSEVLRLAGAEVIGVGAAEYALPTVVFLMPDAMIVDVAMPGQDGVTLVRRLRSLPPDQGGLIPAIALTAVPPTEAARAEWTSAGFQKHLAKPFDPEELIAVLAEVIDYQRGPDRSNDSASAGGSARAK